MTRLRGTFAALAIAGTLCPAGADVPLGVSVSFGALDAIRERPGTDFRVEGDAGFWGRTGAFVGFGWSAKVDVVDAYAGLRRYAGTYGRGAYGGISAGGRFVGEAGEPGPEWSTASTFRSPRA